MGTRPASGVPVEVSALHQAYVDELKSQGLIRTPRVETAFRAIPRHLFVPGHLIEEVYNSELAIGIKASDSSSTSNPSEGPWKSSSSQPAVYAIMLEQLQLEPGHRVLEIAAGTGYNAALMAHIVGETGQIISVEIDEELAAGARDHLAAAGLHQVRVVCADGLFGYPDAAPYDRIIVTVGVWDIAPAWRDQLKAQGRLLLPLMLGLDRHRMQLTVAFEQAGGLRPADGYLQSVSVSNCTFMLAHGALGGPEFSSDTLRFRAYPEATERDPSVGEIVFLKRWTRLECDWS